MFVLLAIINDVFKTYCESLKRDLGAEGFKVILILALLSWAGLFIVLYLALTGQFQMPTDPFFYLLWFGLTFLTEISFTLFLLGMLNTTFFEASSLGNIGFAVTAFYAAIFLGEKYTLLQIGAIAVTVLGIVLFFKKSSGKAYFSANKGAFLILFSLVFSPFEYILYKSATLHTGSYHQFLTGRLIMDFTFYTLFFILVSVFWYKKNPFSGMPAIFSSSTGNVYLIGNTLAELLESWLVFKIPVSLLTVLATLSIPSAYFIGRRKYKEPLGLRRALGAALIAVGVIAFVAKEKYGY